MADVELVLVHGSWGSPEMWRRVVDALGAVYYELAIADLPTTNRSDATFEDDVAHVRSLATAGAVVLCGHSYGSTVISVAGVALANLAHLVYVAGLALDDGETSAAWFAKRPSAIELTVTVLDDGRDLPKGWSENPGRYSPEVLARIRAIELRPQAVFPPVRMSNPAWHEVPSTFVVAADDSLIDPDSQRETAERAGGSVVELDCDHMVNLAAPEELAAVLNRVMAGVSTKGLHAVGTAALNGAIDEQQDDRADHRSDDPGRLDRTVLDVGAEQDVADESADEAAQHAEQPGGGEGHRVGAGHEQARQAAGDQSDNQQHENEPEHDETPFDLTFRG